MNEHEESGARAELWVRAYAPSRVAGEGTALLERLRGLERRGVFGAVTVRTWPRRLSRAAPAAKGAEGRAVLERVASFREWTREHGRSLSPSFRVEGAGAEPTIDAERDVTAGDGVLVLPAVALAEFEDGGLTHVTPHAEGDAVRTVADRIAALSGTEPSPATAVESE